MDALDALLQSPRARDAFVLRCSMDPPWCLRVEDHAPLTIAAVVRGSAWAVADDDPDGGIGMEAGDVALFRGPSPYLVADEPGREPHVLIGPGQECSTLDGSNPFGAHEQSVRSWGNALEGATLLVTGTYETAAQVTKPVLNALPTISVVRRDEWANPTVELLAAEVVKDHPGQSAILDRILDLLCLTTVRACLTRPGSKAPGWYQAAVDPVVGTALDLIHNNPAHPWTVAGLAAEAGSSRAGFARRFRDAVGEPPLTYLRSWRLDLAADELHGSTASIATIAAGAGYDNPFAFSNAFKRHTGTSPSDYRRLLRDPA